MDNTHLARYGLKWNPFSPDIPTEALLVTPPIEDFCWRIEHNLVREGGFSLVTGEPGRGKSVALRILAQRLELVREVTVGALVHPQSSLADFYREMGDLFGVQLRPSNRWGGFRALRERWQAHIAGSLVRPVLLIDEAQEMQPAVLSELRLLASTRYDSRIILCVVLAGDERLTDKLRRDDLLPLGSRIRCRLALPPASGDALRRCLIHLCQSAGNPQLMTSGLIDTLCEHALGNYRVLVNMAAELLNAAAQREVSQLDEKLYFDVFSLPSQKSARHKATATVGKRR